MRNFYEETVVAIYEVAGKTIEDIKYITLGDFEYSLAYIDWDKFAEFAKQIEYNPTIEAEPVISPAIRIGGDNWYMFRTVVKGKERWDSIGLNGNEKAIVEDPSDLINGYVKHKDSKRYKFIDLEK